MNLQKSLQALVLSLLLPAMCFAESSPTLAQAEVEKGMNALRTNQNQEALQFFRQAKKIDSKFAPAYVGEAEVLVLQNAWDEALALLNRAVQLAPEMGVAYHNRGILHYYRQENKEAYTDLSRAVELGETVEQDILSQVWGAAFPDEVIKKMSEQIAAGAKDAQAYLNRGTAYFYKNNFESTRQDWKKAQALGAKISPEMWQELERQTQAAPSV